jgi:hypothetical protein
MLSRSGPLPVGRGWSYELSGTASAPSSRPRTGYVFAVVVLEHDANRENCYPCHPSIYTRRVLVEASWQRRFPSVTLLAFGDRSCLINVGFSEHKPPLITIGWYRWHPDFIEADRTGWGPWHFSEPMRFRRMSHIFQAATTGRQLNRAEREVVGE